MILNRVNQQDWIFMAKESGASFMDLTEVEDGVWLIGLFKVKRFYEANGSIHN